MAFRHVQPGQFSVDLLKQMQAAYDAVCLQLKIDGTIDPRSSKIANIIMDLAAKGEREQLAERTLEIATGPGRSI
jgi:hypothetical protein